MIDMPASWGAVVSRAVMTVVVAFLVLQVKELVDAGMLDTPGAGLDALLIGAGALLVNAVLMVAWPKPQ